MVRQGMPDSASRYLIPHECVVCLIHTKRFMRSENDTELIQTAGRVAEQFGVLRVAGQLYAVLLLADQPLSLTELADRCQVSKASASVHLRDLAKMGAVLKVWVADSRRDHYVVNDDLSSVAGAWVRSAVGRRLRDVHGLVDLLERTIEPDQSESLSRRRAQVVRLVQLADQLVQQLLPLLDALGDTTTAPNDEL